MSEQSKTLTLAWTAGMIFGGVIIEFQSWTLLFLTASMMALVTIVVGHYGSDEHAE